MEDVTPGQIASTISLKCCCGFELKDEIEVCTSLQRFFKSMSCCATHLIALVSTKAHQPEGKALYAPS